MRKHICIIYLLLLMIATGSWSCGAKDNISVDDSTIHVENGDAEVLETPAVDTVTPGPTQKPTWTPPPGSHRDRHGSVVDEDGAVIGSDPNVPFVPAPNAVG